MPTIETIDVGTPLLVGNAFGVVLHLDPPRAVVLLQNTRLVSIHVSSVFWGVHALESCSDEVPCGSCSCGV